LRSIPVKSALIDSASNRYQNGSDVYIARIVRNFLELNEVVDVSQAHRKMRDTFMDEPSILAINKRIQTAASISKKDVKLSVDLGTRNAWEGSLQTYLDNVPFHHIGKGEQSMVKTKLALANKQALNADLLLFEEPENHLSHATLNQLIHEIKVRGKGKQIQQKLVECPMCLKPFMIPVRAQKDHDFICDCGALIFWSDYGVCDRDYKIEIKFPDRSLN
jgi:putative ATP-dependent endonuclease of OLD family